MIMGKNTAWLCVPEVLGGLDGWRGENVPGAKREQIGPFKRMIAGTNAGSVAINEYETGFGVRIFCEQTIHTVYS